VSQRRRKKTTHKKKFSKEEMRTIHNIVSKLSMKQRPDSEIAKEIYKQINKPITRRDISRVKRRVTKEIMDDAKISWEDLSESEKVKVREC
jgi:hypothetical protein